MPVRSIGIVLGRPVGDERGVLLFQHCIERLGYIPSTDFGPLRVGLVQACCSYHAQLHVGLDEQDHGRIDPLGHRALDFERLGLGAT